jgi:DNA-binding XRE family transcriptional regulator
MKHKSKPAQSARASTDLNSLGKALRRFVRKYRPDKLPKQIDLECVTFAFLVQHERERCKLRIAWLARAARVSPQTIALLERCLRVPTLRVMQRVGKALGISAWRLLRQAEQLARWTRA